MKQNIIIASMLIMGGTVSGNAQTNFKAEFNDSTSVRISYQLTEAVDAGSDYAVISTPRLVSTTGDTLRLTPEVFRGKRNWKLVERERFFNKNAKVYPAGNEHSLGDTITCEQTIKYADAPWLWDGRINVDSDREKDGCCDVEPLPVAPLGTFAYIPPFRPLVMEVPDNTGKAGELEKDNPVLCHISKYEPYNGKRDGALIVHFPLDKIKLRRDFRDNAPTLDKVVEITRAILADTTSTVKLIQIVGLASIEGPLQHNIWLAEHRGKALQKYITDNTAATDDMFERTNGGEGWLELRQQIEASDIPGRDGLLNIIDTEEDLNRRERRMKAYDGGVPYSYVRTQMLRDQRNSGYLRIYYDYVQDTAAHVINEATELINKAQYEEALQLLNTVKHDERAQNALGVANYMTGNLERALWCLRRAAQVSNDPQAKENLRQIEAVIEAKKR